MVPGAILSHDDLRCILTPQIQTSILLAKLIDESPATGAVDLD
jgi:hypothetical protein